MVYSRFQKSKRRGNVRENLFTATRYREREREQNSRLVLRNGTGEGATINQDKLMINKLVGALLPLTGVIVYRISPYKLPAVLNTAG